MTNDKTYYDTAFSNNDDDNGDEYVDNLVFVIMSFNDEMNETYITIKDECQKIGLDTKRADENVGSGFIIKEIIQLIEDAEFIICDLTHERPNVYYELGFAHGVGNDGSDLLLIAQEGTTLHFDIMPMRVQYYRSMDQLRAIIKRNLPEMMRITRRH